VENGANSKELVAANHAMNISGYMARSAGQHYSIARLDLAILVLSAKKDKSTLPDAANAAITTSTGMAQNVHESLRGKHHMRPDHLPLRGGLEQDVHTRWRHLLAWRSSDKRKRFAKRSHNKRVRKAWKTQRQAEAQ
jgi:hypothetical protein